MTKKNNRDIGSGYEEQAAACFKRQGYEILDRNYRCRAGEIDLIGRDGRFLVFIEVKFRSSLKAGDPAEAVDRRKQRRIITAAGHYLAIRGFDEDTPCRFDVAAVTESGIRIIKDAFWVS